MKKIDSMLAKGIIPKAAVYARFSSDNQREESIDAQLHAIRAYCQQQKIEIVAEYIDRAKSATTSNRPEFMKMISDAAGHAFEFVIVHKLDRFARNRMDSAICRAELKKHGVSLISVIENIDEDSPESLILESVLEALAEYYSKNLAREVMKGMKENALKCMHTGGVAPLGYNVDPETKRYLINEEESKAVRYIFDAVIEGKGYNQIIRDLDLMGFRTKRGNQFSKNSLHEILRNEKYCGMYVFNKVEAKDAFNQRNNHLLKDDSEIIRIPGGMPRIISDEQFFSVQEILKHRRRSSTNAKAKESYLLAGKIICGACGSSYGGNRKIAGRNKEVYVTYRCNNRASRTSIVCKNKEVNRDYIEAFVLDVLVDIIFDEQLLPRLVAEYNEFISSQMTDSSQVIKNLKKEITETKKQITNLADAIAATGNLSLISALEKQELRQKEIGLEILKIEQKSKLLWVPEEAISQAFLRAKTLFRSKKLEETKQLIDLYV